MKRCFALFLTAVLCLSLFACAKPKEPGAPSVEPPPAEEPDVPSEPLKLDTLGVEFAIGERDTDVLLALQKAFPQTFIDALAGQNAEIGAVTVTFSTSGEATEFALGSGAVQLAFLSAEDFFPYRSGLIVAAEQGGEPDLSQGLVIAAVTDDAAADDRLAEAVRAALPDLAAVLAPYTGETAAGVYAYDEEQLAALAALYEEREAEQAH